MVELTQYWNLQEKKLESNVILRVIVWEIGWTLSDQAGIIRSKIFRGVVYLENKDTNRNVVEEQVFYEIQNGKAEGSIFHGKNKKTCISASVFKGNGG